MSDRERSVVALQALLEVQPANLDARLFLGSVLMSLDKPAEAMAAVKSISSVRNPEQRDNLLHLRAFAALRLNDYAAARSNAQQLKSVTTSESMRSQADSVLGHTGQH